MSYPCLKNKVVLITGASSGIGRATAVHFASLGSKLVLSGRKDSALQETVSQCKGAGDVITIVGDLTIESDVVRIIEKTIEHYKQLDVLVNNAGIARFNSIMDETLEQFDLIMATNVRTVYHLTKLAVPHLIESKGSIVITSSVASKMSCPTAVAYSMSKAALDQFTKSLALDLAPKQVRVNTVNPGMIATKIYEGAMPKDDVPALFERTATIYPTGRIGQPEEIAKSIAFLASSESIFTTGVTLLVDGGFNLTTADLPSQ